MLNRLLERGKTSGRNDDNEISIRKRFKTYLDETMPIIEHFRQQGKTREVNSNRPANDVFNDVALHFGVNATIKSTSVAPRFSEFGN